MDMTELADEILNDDYDSPWKEAVEHYLPEFMAFYFAEAYTQIDWARNYEFLDQELRAVVQDAELGSRFVDKLVRVTLLDGDERWIYIHIEVQGTRQAEFAERMFVYNYRLYDRYRRPVASMAVLADDSENWHPTSFGYNVLGCNHRLEFPAAKLLDFTGLEDELLKNENPFALVTLAHLLTRATRKDMNARFVAKWQLIQLLYQRGWEKQRIIDLFLVLDWMMRLPEHLKQALCRNIEQLEESEKMRYVSSVEQIGIEKGIALGINQGITQGITQGRFEGEFKLLRKQLERRFGTLPAWAMAKLNDASESDMESWAELVLTAPTLEAILSNNATH
jgi:hypothetical protein